MNIRLLLFLTTFFLYNNLIYGECESCTNLNDIITNTGSNTFTTEIADQYYWEICDGNATTENGNCTEACKMVESIDPCLICATADIEISLSPPNPLASCYWANVSINTIDPCFIDYVVNWEWSTNSNFGEILGGTANEVIAHTHPSNNPPPSISICAEVDYGNGIVCEDICNMFNIDPCLVPIDDDCPSGDPLCCYPNDPTCCHPGQPYWPDCP